MSAGKRKVREEEGKAGGGKVDGKRGPRRFGPGGDGEGDRDGDKRGDGAQNNNKRARYEDFQPGGGGGDRDRQDARGGGPSKRKQVMDKKYGSGIKERMRAKHNDKK